MAGGRCVGVWSSISGRAVCGRMDGYVGGMRLVDGRFVSAVWASGGVWACGRVGVWACGCVDIRACGRTHN